MGSEFDCDVLIIGAGPSGANAAALLCNLGYHVIVLERSQFPRFSIGESLLPTCMDFLEESGLLPDVQAAGFQKKVGATFMCNQKHYSFDFSDGFTEGWGATYQVQRDQFDQVLADGAARKGADIRYGCQVETVSLAWNDCGLSYRDSDGNTNRVRARFCMDASGAGRVLAKQLGLDLPSAFPVRKAVFAHFTGCVATTGFDREKITIVIHPDNTDVWYWIIPFAGDICSVGVVAESAFFEGKGVDDQSVLKASIFEDPFVACLLSQAAIKQPVRHLTGYSSGIKSLHGDGFAILGNAGEFLDPIFSSGVTIALKSASLAVQAFDRQAKGEDVSWEDSFARPLKAGIDTFRTYVEAWYSGDLQKVFFFPNPNAEIIRMLCSILAGYVWDTTNPYVNSPRRRLVALAALCSD